MRRLIWLAIGVLLCASSAFAQDPCPTGAVQAPSFQVKSGVVTVTACHDEKDDVGQPSPIVGWRTVVDGTKAAITMSKNPTPSPTSGQFLFTGTFTVTKGNHQFSLENDQSDGVGGVVTSSAGPFGLAGKGGGKAAAVVVVK